MPKKDLIKEIEDFRSASVTIDPMDLNTEYTNLPAQLAYWNSQLAMATEDKLRAKADYEEQQARVLLHTREDAEFRSKKVTVAEVNANVVLHDDVSDSNLVLIEKTAEELRIKGIVDAIHCKRDMLQSLGAKLRIEMMADPQVRDMMSGSTLIDFEKERR